MAAAHSREVEAGKCELQHGADTQAGEADVASSESAESAEEYESMPCMGANIRPLHLFSAWCQNFLLWLLLARGKTPLGGRSFGPPPGASGMRSRMQCFPITASHGNGLMVCFHWPRADEFPDLSRR